MFTDTEYDFLTGDKNLVFKFRVLPDPHIPTELYLL